MLQLDNKGKYTGKYKRRRKVALDVGCAIKGQHVDMHQGIGSDDDHSAVCCGSPAKGRCYCHIDLKEPDFSALIIRTIKVNEAL